MMCREMIYLMVGGFGDSWIALPLIFN